MPSTLVSSARSIARISVAMVPWVVAMYCFYWLDSSGTWSSETPHRGKMSVVLLGTGMMLSFLLYSLFRKRERN